MRNNELAKSILSLYNTVKNDNAVSFENIENVFSKSKIYEPIVHSSNVYGKVPTNRHILEDEIEEYPFQDIK